MMQPVMWTIWDFVALGITWGGLAMWIYAEAERASATRKDGE